MICLSSVMNRSERRRFASVTFRRVTFVLVHGGAHGAWCWERMIPHLRGDAIALDLPGRGSKPAALESVTADDWADSVAKEITDRDLNAVILVGHSLAGITLPRVAERVPDRLAGLRAETPATYIKLLRDQSVSPESQDRMIETLGAPEVLELDAGHDAMVSRPAELAALLDRIAAEESKDRSAVAGSRT